MSLVLQVTGIRAALSNCTSLSVIPGPPLLATQQVSRLRA